MSHSDLCNGPIWRVIVTFHDAILEPFSLAEPSPSLPES